MAEPTKSVLLVDYDSLQRSLAGAVGETRLAERAAAWLAAMESGRLLGDDGNRRRIAVKRCYVSPSARGKSRDALAVAGFEMIDAAESGSRNAADLHMAMDTVELLARSDGYEEFILLSAGNELAPLLTRLKAAKRATAIFADGSTAEGDKTLADLVLESSDFARFLNTDPKPVPETKAEPAATPASASSERADIEAFARRIHAATNIPLFSPKTFAELFRHLTDEIAANGYHFQSTAKNVAERMVAGGRNVNRRQVVFIVKGLALKGHVFSTNDTPERLAEVFREQAHYLIGNAGITLNEREENLLSAWFLSRPPPSTLPATPPNAPSAPPTAATIEAPPAAKAAIAETIEREVAKAVTKPSAPEKPKLQPPRPAPPAATQTRPPPVRPVDLPKSTAPKPVPLASAREEAKAVIAARIAGAAKMKPAGARAPLPAKAAPKPPAPERAAAPAKPAPPVPTERSAENSEALESSILAAIAEAVDVLVEDSAAADEADLPIEMEEDEAPPAREAPQRRSGNQAARPAEPEPEPPAAEEDDDAESGDIGDQIQRIIASYNRNRGDE